MSFYPFPYGEDGPFAEVQSSQEEAQEASMSAKPTGQQLLDSGKDSRKAGEKEVHDGSLW